MNRHTSTGILARIARAILLRIPAEVCPFTRIRMTRLITSFMLQNFSQHWYYAQKNLFKILLNQTEIRLYLKCTDWLSTKQTSIWFQINWKMVNTIWFLFDSIRFWKDFSVLILQSVQVIFTEPLRLGSNKSLRFFIRLRYLKARVFMIKENIMVREKIFILDNITP